MVEQVQSDLNEAMYLDMEESTRTIFICTNHVKVTAVSSKSQLKHLLPLNLRTSLTSSLHFLFKCVSHQSRRDHTRLDANEALLKAQGMVIITISGFERAAFYVNDIVTHPSPLLHFSRLKFHKCTHF